MNPRVTPDSPVRALHRVRFLYAVIAVVIGIFFVRLFYLQVIKHDFYRKSAMSDQLKEYEIPAARGVIKAHEGDAVVPIVLNEKLFTIYADPSMIKKVDKTADKLAAALNMDKEELRKKITQKDTRYVVLARRVAPAVKDQILKHKLSGVGAQQQSYRTYPNGSLAAQTLGFVNNDGKGAYGVEQALQSTLGGKPGQLKAVTDVNGVPLAANTDNVLVQPENGSDVVLTLEMPLQKQLENILQQGLKNAKSDAGSAIIMDVKGGGVKAMANWPTYDPGNYGQVENGDVYTNPAVSDAIEVGSIMKPLTMAAALNTGAVQKDTSYFDPAVWKIDNFNITNIEEDGGSGHQNMATLLNLSLNTGATWLVMRMGGSNDTMNQKGREVWHDYMVNHYRFGRETNIEQGYESAGLIPDPNKGYGRNLTYANTSFGQGMSATMLQIAAAYAAMLNGGTYYQPRLVDQTISPDGTAYEKKPVIVRKDVVSPQVSEEMQDLLEYVVDNHSFHPGFDQNKYSVGGKTGTAQIAKPDGGYYADDYNGTYAGFVGGDDPQYVIVVRVAKPKIGGYAGSAAAQPIFGSVAHMILNTYNVAPRR